MKSPMDRPMDSVAVECALRLLLKGIRPQERLDICEWAEQTVDMGVDATAGRTGYITLYPYQREILRDIDDPHCREVTIMAGQRLGKSQCWRLALLKRIADGGCVGLVVYPSLELAKKTNEDTLRPLISLIPDAMSDLSRRGNVRVDSYHLPSLASVIYFLGGGSQVISQTANFAVMDECDFVDLANSDAEGRNMSQIKALRLRMQSYEHRMLVECSSPSTAGGPINRAWERGSQGVWHLRCLGCGGLTPCNRLALYMDGTKWGGLQWEKDENGRIRDSSIRWVCPKCGREHPESEAYALNDGGEFVHAFKGNTCHRSFCIGALANPRLWSWSEIAQAQEDAAAGGSDEKKFLANTILGIPYRHKVENDSSDLESKLRALRQDYPSDLGDRLSGVFAGVDQQMSELGGQKYYVAVIRGWDEYGNSWLLSAGVDNTLEDLERRLDAEYFGHRISLALLDYGGFNNDDDLLPYIRRHPNAWFYKGCGQKDLKPGEVYARSDAAPKLFLCNAIHWQVRLLDSIYSPRRPSGYQWILPPDPPVEYLQQMSNVRPNTHMGKDSTGMQYANWAAFGSARRDFFDAEKMALCALQIACREMPAHGWRRGHLPRFAAIERIRELARQKKIQRK